MAGAAELRACCARVTLIIPGALTLKDRRSVTKSIVERLKGRFNLSVADLDGGGNGAGTAILGMAAVSSASAHAEKTIGKAVEWIESDGRTEVTQVEIFLL